MKIIASDIGDIPSIFYLYQEGTAYQKQVAKKHWRGFERSLIEKEVSEKRQWKIMIDNEIVCVFAIAFEDSIIWKEKNNDPAIYIHRIATHPDFRGNGYVKHIVQWAKDYCRTNNKKYIRMDTGSGNDRLNNYYISCGFHYLGIAEYDGSQGLPAHYRGGSSSLFEIRLD